MAPRHDCSVTPASTGTPHACPRVQRDADAAGGTYVFCSVNLLNGGRLALAPGAAVKIYIDSPERPGSTCASGTGFVRAQNSNGINWPGGDVKDAAAADAAKNLHLYAFGNSALETATPNFCGDAHAWGAISCATPPAWRPTSTHPTRACTWATA